jgi:hypothetical protein
MKVHVFEASKKEGWSWLANNGSPDNSTEHEGSLLLFPDDISITIEVVVYVQNRGRLNPKKR